MLPQLNVDINSVDTTVALIPDRTIVPAIIESAIPEENSKKTGYNLVVKFKTTEALEESTVPNKPVPAGRVLTNYYPLQPSEKQIEAGNPDQWLDRVVELVDTALGTEQGNRPQLDEAVASLVGKEVLLTIRVEEDESGQYGTQNRIGKVAPVG